MERAVEPENWTTDYDVLPEPTEEVSIAPPKRKARRVYRTPVDLRFYAKPLAGLATIVVLLFVPMITIPGMVILVLVAEVYLLDWTYSKVGLLRDELSSISKESTERSPEDEIDKKVARTNPKDQFIR